MTLYPWGGDFLVGNNNLCVAIVTLSSFFNFPEEKVAIWGRVYTENLGVERIVANVISNPNIRFVIVCGEEVRGHLPGDALINLHRAGIDADRRIVAAGGAIPYIENIDESAINRFREQVEIIDMRGVTEVDAIGIDFIKNPGPFGSGEPYIAIRFEKRKEAPSTLFLHRSVEVLEFGDVVELLDEILFHEKIRVSLHGEVT
jgi:tetrahydromethanopterin S-methyltransferase subunit A